MRILSVFTLLISAISFGQAKLPSVKLSDTGNVLNPAYLKSLDSTFGKVRLIGLGESTHGTSQFTTIRADIFKYLVVNHNYSVFFLEADYNACARLNRYINGADDNVREATLEILLWPWLTQELVDLIDWMRLYNQAHNNILEFVGCDMQLIKDDIKELPRIFSVNSEYQDFSSKLPDLNFDMNDTSLLIIKQREWKEFSVGFLKAFPEEEVLMIKSLTQWFEEALYKANKANFRDSCMGNNIADYLENHPGLKGIYFAHNGHVGKISKEYKDPLQYFRRAGYFLDERLKGQYYAIALEFNIGSFNAINYIDSAHVMEYFTITKPHRKSLSHLVMGDEDHIKFITSSAIPDKKRLKIKTIGAIYGRSKEGYRVYPNRWLRKEQYDSYLIINKGTPTNLLSIKSSKSAE